MTDEEFEILDELYFVISYADLQSKVEMSDEDLYEIIHSLFTKGWVRVFESPDDTRDFENITAENLANAYLLASKTGLKAHNS